MTMQADAVLTRIEEGIGRITLNRPQSMNTFSTELAEGLCEAFQAMEKNPEVRVVVLDAEGKNFSTGIDLKEFLSKERHEIREFLGLMDRHNHVLFGMSKPVIASVRGYTLANGAGLALACDFIVAASDAVFGTTAINVGLICLEPGYQLARWIGPKKALQYVLTGDFIPAGKALELGITYRVVPPEDLEGATMELARKLAVKSPLALRTGKRGLQQMEGLPLERAVEYAGERFAALAATEDAREGLLAFLEKRQPTWKER